MRKINNILVTGGAGFIGSNFIHYLFGEKEFSGKVINLDNLSYAGNLQNLAAITAQWLGKRYFFEKADICDFENVRNIMVKYDIDTIVHFAAESHVDRSIYGPKSFMQINIMGTFNLLEVVRDLWNNRNDVLFHHISTDEVYGSLGDTGFFYETTPYNPNSPYSASKASSDFLVKAYNNTYNLPVTISNCSNNYGPYQFPEKMIPLMILNILDNEPLPVYGDGKNIRDWIYVDDHNAAVWAIITNGQTGATYNVGGNCEMQNIDLVNLLCEKIACINGKSGDEYKKLIRYVKDRPGHDRRYAINCSKIMQELNWQPRVNFEQGIGKTIDWYMNNQAWVTDIKTGEYMNWISQNYNDRR